MTETEFAAIVAQLNARLEALAQDQQRLAELTGLDLGRGCDATLGQWGAQWITCRQPAGHPLPCGGLYTLEAGPPGSVRIQWNLEQ